MVDSIGFSGYFEARVNDGRVHLFVERLHLTHDALGLHHVGDGLITGRAKVSRHRGSGGGLASVGAGQVPGIVDQLGRTANRTLHVHSSLKATISTSSNVPPYQ